MPWTIIVQDRNPTEEENEQDGFDDAKLLSSTYFQIEL
jgi:hypothetical protein